MDISKSISKIYHKLSKMLSNPIFIMGLISIIIIVVSCQTYFLGIKTVFGDGNKITYYNNYLIFRQSFIHLIENKDLYQLYPKEYWDYYKYSPTFPIIMAPFSFMPIFLGLLIWNLLNALVLVFAFCQLPFDKNKSRLFAIGFILIELITSIQSSQSNALIAGLLILAFIFLEKNRPLWASLAIIVTIFIKIFGVFALVLFIFYPNKLRSVLYAILWIIVLFSLPLIFISPSQLATQYQSWFTLLQQDHESTLGLSVMTLLKSWFGLQSSKNLIQLMGLVLLCLPLVKFRVFKELNYKLLFLSFILIWIVIFNHKAESPSFIIPIAGISIWYFMQKNNIVNGFLIIFAFILTILSPTDLFPETFKDKIIIPYVLKTLPCILIWCKILFDLLSYRSEKYNIQINKM